MDCPATTGRSPLEEPAPNKLRPSDGLLSPIEVVALDSGKTIVDVSFFLRNKLEFPGLERGAEVGLLDLKAAAETENVCLSGDFVLLILPSVLD